jgi:5-methyltetrahydropteroyltriglutamate--homocysteine methyltransferase
MKRSERRILTTHTGRLPNPPTIRELLAARANDPAKFDELVQGGVADLVRKQVALKNDIHSDGEFWKARDQMYYDSRTTGVEMQPVTADQPAWRLAQQPERRMPEFREFYEIYDAVGNTPMPGVTIQPATHRGVITGPLEYRGQGAIKHEIAVVKAGIAAAGASVDDFFLSPAQPRLVSPLPLERVLPDGRGVFLRVGRLLPGRLRSGG